MSSVILNPFTGNFQIGSTSGGGGGGVSTLNGLSGALSLIAGSGITITPSGSHITIAATGGAGANTALSNLIATSINQNLVPSSDGAHDLGTGSKEWGTVFTSSVHTSLNPSNISFSSNTITDLNGNESIDFFNRTLNDNVGGTVVSWNTPGILDASTSRIINLTNPVNPQDAATKNYVDSASSNILAFTSTATVGGADQETVAVTGLLATDTILSVSQKTFGSATRTSQMLIQWSNVANNAITLDWVADPGSGAVVVVAVKR